MGLLPTYTHDSELQAVTAPPLISTIHISPQHPPSLFQPAVPSPAVPWQRLLKVEILQLDAFRFYFQSLLYITELIAPAVLVITFRHGPHTKRIVFYSNSVFACIFVAAGTWLPSRCPETVRVYRATA
jgi:hypothetical protein